MLRRDRVGLRHVVLLRWALLPSQQRLEPTWDDVLNMGWKSVDEKTLAAVEAAVDAHDVVNLQFTSGTTGAPKAAMLTHHSIINNGILSGVNLALTPDDVVCCAPPLFHSLAIVGGFLACFTRGACVAFAGRDFDAAAVVDLLQRERCTGLHGVPTMLQAVLEEMDRRSLTIDTVKKGIAGGSKVAPALAAEVQRRLGYTFLTIAYGMTETAPASFMTEATDEQGQQRETVGCVMPHTAAKIVDAQGRIVPLGVRGEICVAGYLLQQGYFRAPQQTAEAMQVDAKGVLWMHTGDEGFLDAQGYLRITGRIKDIIIRSGENIYPLEIEECLLQHPAISHVQVVGVKDVRYGEAVAAFVSVRSGHDKPSDETLRAWVCAELARHKAPQHIWWVGMGEAVLAFPATGSGKVRKDELSREGNRLLASRDKAQL